MSNVGEIESALFKRVAGGHIFQAPNPWLFGRSSRYLVNDTQKAQLLAIITPRRPTLWVVVLAAGIGLWAAVASVIVWAFGSGHDQPTAYDMVAMTLLIFVPLILALMMALRRNLRRMQPVLAGLPRTDERISHSERQQAMAAAMSFRRALLIGAAWTVILLLQIFVISHDRHLPFSNAQSFLNVFLAVVAAGLAANYLVIAIRKAMSKKTA